MDDAFEQLSGSAARLADARLWSLSDTDLLARLDLIHQVEQTIAAVKAHLIREVDSRSLPAADNARSTGSWLGCRWRLKTGTARSQVELADALQRRCALNQALITGTVNTEQAAVIYDCVHTLPAQIGVEAIDLAEGLLIGWAADFDATGLRTLANRILAYVAPDIAEQVEATQLAKLEADAHEARAFTLSSPVDGRVRIKGSLDVEAAAIVEAALEPLCSPRTRTRHTNTNTGTGTGTGTDATSHAGDTPEDRVTTDDRRPEQRRADALVEVCQLALRTGDLPINGGEPPQMNVTVTYEPLTDDLTTLNPNPTPTFADRTTFTGTARDHHHPVTASRAADRSRTTRPRRRLGIGTLGNGNRISPATVRRLACDARILPAVLGTDGQILDVGRTKRLIDKSLRQALVLRDQGCAFPTCTRPARWSEGHHIVSWADGGSTSLNNAVLLCRPHHRTIHHTDWTVKLGHDGLPDFIPPTYLDLEQQPRRNLYHRRT